MKNWDKSDTKFLYKLIAGVVIVAVLFGIGFYNQFEREEMLKNGFDTKATITWVNNANTKGRDTEVKYYIRNKSYKNLVQCNCVGDNQVGDTVVIRVSKDDYNVIHIVDSKFEKSLI